MFAFFDDLRTAVFAPLRQSIPGAQEALKTTGLGLFGSGDRLLSIELAEYLIDEKDEKSFWNLQYVKNINKNIFLLQRKNENIEEAITREARALELHQKIYSALGMPK